MKLSGLSQLCVLAANMEMVGGEKTLHCTRKLCLNFAAAYTPTAGVVQLTVAVVEVHLLLFGVLLCFAVAAAPEREETRQRYHGDAMRLLLTVTYMATRKNVTPATR